MRVNNTVTKKIVALLLVLVCTFSFVCTSFAYDSVAECQAAYQQARANGDTAGMAAAHAAAEAIRQQADPTYGGSGDGSGYTGPTTSATAGIGSSGSSSSSGSSGSSSGSSSSSSSTNYTSVESCQTAYQQAQARGDTAGMAAAHAAADALRASASQGGNSYVNVISNLQQQYMQAAANGDTAGMAAAHDAAEAYRKANDPTYQGSGDGSGDTNYAKQVEAVKNNNEQMQNQANYLNSILNDDSASAAMKDWAKQQAATLGMSVTATGTKTISIIDDSNLPKLQPYTTTNTNDICYIDPSTGQRVSASTPGAVKTYRYSGVLPNGNYVNNPNWPPDVNDNIDYSKEKYFSIDQIYTNPEAMKLLGINNYSRSSQDTDTNRAIAEKFLKDNPSWNMTADQLLNQFIITPVAQGVAQIKSVHVRDDLGGGLYYKTFYVSTTEQVTDYNASYTPQTVNPTNPTNNNPTVPTGGSSTPTIPVVNIRGSITVKVIDAETYQVIPGATVNCGGSVSYTNTQGMSYYSNLDIKSFNVTASAAGYQDNGTTVTLTNDNYNILVTIPLTFKPILYNFRITDIRDPNFRNLFFDKSGAATGAFYPVSRMPVDKHPTLGACTKKGYAFYFDLQSKGFNGSADYVIIKPRFYYMKGLGTDDIKSAYQVDLYYDLGDSYFIKVGDPVRDKVPLRYDWNASSKDMREIGSFSQISLTPNVRVTQDERTATWYGRYFIPSTTKAVRKDVPIVKNGALDESVFLTKGYILVNFTIEGYKNGAKVFEYNPGQWTAEGGPKSPLFYTGDTLIFDNENSAIGDYGTGTDR